MKNRVIVTLISALLVTGCTIGWGGGRGGESVSIVPALPATIEMDANQPYYQNGYYYSHRGTGWYYSQSRDGSWSRLPRSHYPREVHYRIQGERVHDGRDYDNRDHD
jgi:hypothetical protein